MVAPELCLHSACRLHSLGSGASASAAHVRVVDVGQGMHLSSPKASDIAGTILLVHSDEMHTWDDLFGEVSKPPESSIALSKLKPSRLRSPPTRPHDLLYRHTKRGRRRNRPPTPWSWLRARMLDAWRACWPSARSSMPTCPCPVAGWRSHHRRQCGRRTFAAARSRTRS